MLALLLVATLLTGCFGIGSKTYEVTITVVDIEETPLHDVLISINGEEVGTTDENERLTVTELSEKVVTISATLEEYLTASETVDLSKTKQVKIVLYPEGDLEAIKAAAEAAIAGLTRPFTMAEDLQALAAQNAVEQYVNAGGSADDIKDIEFLRAALERIDYVRENNIVDNSDFETGINGWDNWEGFDFQSEDVRSGQFSAVIAAGSAGGGANFGLPWKTNTTYIMGGWGKGVGHNTIGVQPEELVIVDGDPWIAFSSGEWEYKELEFSTSDDIENFRIFIWKNSLEAFYFDDIFEVEKPADW